MSDHVVYKPFPWRTVKGGVEECRVIVRNKFPEPTVHVLSYAGGMLKSTGVYFHPDELDDIIAALKCAKEYLATEQ